jgi:hypothetical protein
MNRLLRLEEQNYRSSNGLFDGSNRNEELLGRNLRPFGHWRNLRVDILYAYYPQPFPAALIEIVDEVVHYLCHAGGDYAPHIRIA